MIRLFKRLMVQFFLPVFLIGVSHAQNNMHFKSYGTEDGLSNAAVKAIVVDRLGFLWVGTSNGLNRFDGYEFKQYLKNTKDSMGIGFTNISSLYVDNSGNIWIGGAREGMSFYDSEKQNFTNFKYNPEDNNSLSSNNIKSIAGDLSGNIWIASKDSGLVSYNPIENKFIRYKADDTDNESIPSNRIRTMIVDSKNRIWIGTYNNGVAVINSKGKLLQHFVYDPRDANSISYNSINHIYESSDGLIWIGTYVKGLCSYNEKTGEFQRYFDLNSIDGYRSKSAKCIFEDSKSRLWVGSWSGGLYEFDRKDNQFKNYRSIADYDHSISDSRVLSICEDKSGQLWVGTQVGLNKVDVESGFVHYIHEKEEPNSISGNNVYAIAEDSEGNVWIGTYRSGLSRYNRKEEKFYHYYANKNDVHSLHNNTIWDIHVDAKNRVWFGVTGGILKYNLERDNFDRFNYKSNSIDGLKDYEYLGIEEDKDGKLWLMTWTSGLICYDPETDKAVEYRHKPNDPQSISSNGYMNVKVDSKNRVWAGTTSKGLNLFNRENNTFIKFYHDPNDGNSIASNRIENIFEDSDKNIWVQAGEFLNLFNPVDSSFKKIAIKGKNGNLNIYGILEDKQKNFWLSTTEGLCKFNRENESTIWYDMHDGLNGNDFSLSEYYAGRSGRFYYGGTNGFSEFFPENIKQNSFIPPIVITKIKLFNEELKVEDGSPLSGNLNFTKKLELNHDQNTFSFEFSALNFRQATKNKFAYMLEGVDDDWIYTDYRYRRASYNKVAPGNYTFKVKASNDDGLWNEEGIAIDIRIFPPWWKTWWARTLWFTLGGAVLMFIYLIRVSVLKRQKRALENQVRERTEEVVVQKEEIEAQAEELKATNEKLIELDKFKQGMTAMIVHDLKNPLNAVINVEESKPMQSLKKAKQFGKQMLNLVLNILDVNKYEEISMVVDKTQHELADLVRSAVEEVKFLADQKSINVKNNFPDGIIVLVDKEIITRVLVNMLSNAVKYSPPNGEVSVRTGQKEENGRVIIFIEDKGVGIPNTQIDKIFDKFWQVEAKKSGGVRSTGLGLTFCKIAVEAHGGKIGVESQLNQGSKFWFTLDLVMHEKKLDKSVESSVEKEKDEVSLSMEDKEFIRPFIEKLQEVLVYETSEIEDILCAIDSKSKAIEVWVSEIKDCLYAMNEEKYKQLINQAIL